MKQKDLSVIVPLRKGSKRVLNKNIKPFLNKSLIKYKLEVVISLGYPITVDTDDLDVIEYAKTLGLNTIIRPEYFASDQCTNSEYHEYLGKSAKTENILIAQVTNPLIRRSTFLDAINIFFENDCNGLMSVQKVKTFLWDDKGPINYNLSEAVNSQNLPDYWSPTFGVVLCNKNSLIKNRNLMSHKSFLYELDDYEAIDIDTPYDFWLAEKALEYKGEMKWLKS